MNQVLSQEEIDALLRGISEGEVDTQPEEEVLAPPSEVEVETFDFVRLTKGKKERLPALQFVYDRFSKSLATALTIFIEREVEVAVSPISYLEYTEMVKNLPLPTNMNVVMTENLKGFFIVIFDAKLIFSVLETMFGSTHISAPKVEGREFTKIEINVIRKLINIVCAEMEKAWAPVFDITCKYSRSELNPAYITMVAPEETVSLCEFSISIEDINSWLKVCIPYAVLEPIKAFLTTSVPSREDKEMRERWYRQLESRIMDVPIELRAVLGKKRMSVEEFMKLREDSVFVIDKYINDPVRVEIDNKTKLIGKMGNYKGNKAIKVEEIIN